MSVTPLPCPFCGAEAAVGLFHEGPWYAVRCPQYGCASRAADKIETAIAAWNQRAPDPRIAEVARIVVAHHTDGCAAGRCALCEIQTALQKT